jgi:low affinity Fe/Cu permease
MHELFRKFAGRSSAAMGTSWAFMLALASILIWSATGPIFHYSDTWHLVVNDWTNIVTFFMVFLIQNMQNRDAKAMQLKLDELIKATKGARNSLMNLDRLTDEEMSQLESEYKRLCAQHINGTGQHARVQGMESANS